MKIDFLILSLRHEKGPRAHVDGRQNALKALKDGLSSIGCRPYWLTLQVPANRFMAFALGALRWIGSTSRGKILPLQCMVALQGRVGAIPQSVNDAHADRRAESSTIIYVDGVRLAQQGRALRSRVGGRLLIDFDDLMSRRVARMLRNGEEVSFGGFVRFVPPSVQMLVEKIGPLRTMLLGFEKRLLRRAELDAALAADAIGFASAYEAALFRRFQRRYASKADPQYLVLGPSTRRMGELVGDTVQRQPPRDLRFIFIGSDSQQQNRITIQAIVELARANALALPVYIYGRMTRDYEQLDNVMFCGFSEALAQVYRPGSILLMARSVRGGIKSKIIEAFEHGIPTVGTSSALEGFEGAYPWRVDGAALRQLVGDASRLREGYHEALASGISICKAQFSSRRYWRVLGSYSFSGANVVQEAAD
ncbi:MAG TPA: glycosyltransferase [Acetobacteraceae bacterium]|nr:glycosyltransferase [Acetobacteraceae bacterium]